MPAFRMEKPPVPPVANTTVRASNTGMSNTNSRNMATDSPR